jgi:hypothetical protein
MSFSCILKRHFILISGILLSIYLLNGVIAIPQLSITGDEADHLNYAVRFVKGHPEKVKPFDDASTMPMSGINVIPRFLQQIFQPGLKKYDGGISDVFLGRYITLVFSVMIGLIILLWSAQLYGRLAGLFSLFLFVFCPNLTAHSLLLTTDSFSAFFTISTAYFFWKAVNKATFWNLFFFSISLGLAQLAKQSLTHLFIIFSLLFVFLYFFKKITIINFRKAVFKIAFMAFIIIFIINAGFWFQHTGMALNDYEFSSHFFNTLKTNSSFLNSVPLPFPEPYIEGLDLTKNIDEMGGGRPESSGNIYLLGESRKGTGFWYYYFVVLFFKTPIPVLISTFLMLIFLKRNTKEFYLNEFVPLFTISYFLVYFNFFYNSQVGIRHIIMIFPLLYVLLGGIVNKLVSSKFMPLILMYSVCTFYFYFPNLIAYSNEFVLPKKNAYKIMADSNIDFRQSYFLLEKYLENHPDVQWAPKKPQAGKFVIGINEYLNLNNSNNTWLRKFIPIRQVHHSYLLFQITEKDFKDTIH